MKKINFKKVLLRGGTFTLALALGLVGAYMVTPQKRRTLSAPSSTTITPSTPIEETHFEKFVNKVTREVTDEGIQGLEANFDNFKITYKMSEDAVETNTIQLDGGFQFTMESLEDINFVANLDIDYNGKNLPLLAGFVGKTLYVGVKDIRIKASQTSFDGLIDTIENYYYAASGLDLDLSKIYNKLKSVILGDSGEKLDVNALLSKFTKKPTEEDPTGVSFETVETTTENGYKFDLNVDMTTSSKDKETEEVSYKTNKIRVSIDVDKSYNLTKVDLKQLDFGTLSISGAINMEVKPLKVLLPDYDYVGNDEGDANSPYYNSNYHYVEVVSYDGWLKKLANLLSEDNQKLGLAFTANMGINKDDVKNELGKIVGSINVDFSELIDLSEYKHDPSYWDDEEEVEYEFEDDPYVKKGFKTRGLDTNDLLNKVKDGLKLGLELDIYGQNNTLYSNLSLNYEEGDGYLTFNKYQVDENTEDAVVKAKLDAASVKWMIEELPGLFQKETNDNEEKTSELFSFVTDSEFVTAAKTGDFSGILDMLTTLSNDDKRINVGVDLSSLGFDGTEISLVLDSTYSDENKVLSLNTTDINLGNFALSLGLNTEQYKQVDTLDKDVYQSLSFLPGVFEQVADILDTKKTGFALDGSVLSTTDGTGLLIDGDGQFDYGTKYGYGDLTIKQLKYSKKTVNNPWATHQISLDVRNDNEDKSKNDIKFVYGDINSNENIKGKITVKTITDIIDMVMELVNDGDERFTKFVDPIMTALGMSAFSSVLDSGDYLRFAKNDLIKSVDFSEEGIVVVIGGNLFGLANGNDIRISVNFKNVVKGLETSQNIESLEVKLIYGTEVESQKDISIKLSLKDFSDERLSTIKSYDAANPNAKYMDFSSIKVLLDLGIRTTKLGYYNLSAVANVKAGSVLSTGDIDIGVHILVDGENVKLYSKLTLPYIVRRLSRHADLLSPSDITSELVFETYPDGDPNKTNGVGGYFMIKKTIDPRIGKDRYVYYKSTSKNFLDNIIKYLLVGILDLGDTIVNSIGDIDLGGDSGEEKAPGKYTALLPEDGFTYNGNENNPEWNLILELGKALNIDALKTANVKITGANGYLAQLVAKLNVQASILSLNVNLTANLNNPNPNVTTFPSDVQTSFNEIHKASLATVVTSRLNQVDNPYETTSRIK
ncbi:MAG: hypothetical protein K5925_00225 [Bacilli bacterium]|nr:hypothetical protein [Bacilli bacterium]